MTCQSDYLLISKHHTSPMGGKRSKGLCSKLQKQTATYRWSQCGFFSCKGVWEHWPVCSQNSKEIDNPGRYLYWGRSFLTGNRQSSSTNSPPVIDCLVFWGMWAAREEGCWTCKELIPSSGESKLVSCCWWAMDGDGDGDCDGCMAETPWLGAETDWYLFLIRNTGDKSLYEDRRA